MNNQVAQLTSIHCNKPITTPKSQQRPKQKSMAKPIERIHENIQPQIDTLFQNLFDKVDDSFFHLAQNAKNNQDQQNYFAAMRTIRMNKLDLKNHYMNSFEQCFRKLNQTPAVSTKATDTLTLEGLKLVQNEDLEIEVAINSMSNKVRNSCESALFDLQTRLEAILPYLSLDRENLPLDPLALSLNFEKCLCNIEIEIEAKLVLFKEFEQQILEKTPELVKTANDILINMGILPDLKLNKAKQTAEANQETITKDNEAIQTSANNIASITQNPTPQNPVTPNYTIGQILAPSHITSILSLLQQEESEKALPQKNSCQIYYNTPTEPMPTLQEKLSHAYSNEYKISKTDEEALNTITMMFNLALADGNIPKIVKYSLSRLQIPYLKIALLHHDFFLQSSHPTRKLLNSMSHAASRINDQSIEDPLINEIDKIVDIILEQYEEDITLFDTLLLEFESYLSKHEERIQTITNRLKCSEQGKHKTEEAQAKIDYLLKEKLAGQSIPTNLHKLFDQWLRQLLVFQILRSNNENTNKDYQKTIQLLENLIWSLNIEGNKSNRLILMKRLPNLLNELRESLKLISCSPFEMGDIFKKLNQEHLKILQFEKHTNHSEKNIELPSSLKLGVTDQTIQNDSAIEKTKISLKDWVEIEPETGTKVRCQFALHFKHADKLIFTNRLGIKVFEFKSKEINTLIDSNKCTKLESDALFDSALKTVVCSLQEEIQSQQAI